MLVITRSLKLLWTACLLLLALISSSQILQASEQKFVFNIPRQSLNNTLLQLASITQLTLIVDSEAIRDMQSPPLKGRYSVAEALNVILAAHPLRYQFKWPLTVVTLTVLTKQTHASQPVMPAHSETGMKVLQPMEIVGKTYAQQADVSKLNPYLALHSNSATFTRTAMCIYPVWMRMLFR